MYVDLGKRRGRLRFTWKELCAIWALGLSAVGYVVRSEVALATLNAQVSECQRELRVLRLPATLRGGVTGGDHIDAANQQTKEATQ